jgi:hypothetical protein
VSTCSSLPSELAAHLSLAATIHDIMLQDDVTFSLHSSQHLEFPISNYPFTALVNWKVLIEISDFIKTFYKLLGKIFRNLISPCSLLVMINRVNFTVERDIVIVQGRPLVKV